MSCFCREATSIFCIIENVFRDILFFFQHRTSRENSNISVVVLLARAGINRSLNSVVGRNRLLDEVSFRI